jgi:hypothetical protein
VLVCTCGRLWLAIRPRSILAHFLYHFVSAVTCNWIPLEGVHYQHHMWPVLLNSQTLAHFRDHLYVFSHMAKPTKKSMYGGVSHYMNFFFLLNKHGTYMFVFAHKPLVKVSMLRISILFPCTVHIIIRKSPFITLA